ncbi:MAG: porin [Acidobacteria bacterium]|nr:porin [Acidobacteriota bacterium]
MQVSHWAPFLVLALAARHLAAQTPSDEIGELKRIIEQQKQQLRAQQAQIEAIEARLNALARPATPPAPPVTPTVAAAVAKPAAVPATAKLTAAPRWFEKYSLRGYTQIRTNRLATTNSRLICEQCDRSIGGGNNVLIRRARFILSGDVNDRVFIYFQPDFASTATQLHFGQIRDLYFDVALDRKKEFRFRFGQSKVPFGFDNLQSSQNRLPLDRSDAINSAALNERDLGAMFYWAPAATRKQFAHLVSSGLKGSGDYGVLGVGVYNGQTNNRPEGNNNMHIVGRASYPVQLANGQIVEAGVQVMTGRYAVTPDQRSPNIAGPVNFRDRRVAATFVLYPQPFGFQAEYNTGTGPAFDPALRLIRQRGLHGGYGILSYRRRVSESAFLTPYLRYQYYSGGKKYELDARKYLVRSVEAGLEWQPNPFLEWTAEFVHGNRTFEDLRLPANQQRGSLLRLQLQVSY